MRTAGPSCPGRPPAIRAQSAAPRNGPGRRTAIADDDRRDALADRRDHRRGRPGDTGRSGCARRRTRVSPRVPGLQPSTRGTRRRRVVTTRDPCDAVVPHPDGTDEAGLAAPVDDGGAVDDEIVHGRDGSRRTVSRRAGTRGTMRRRPGVPPTMPVLRAARRTGGPATGRRPRRGSVRRTIRVPGGTARTPPLEDRSARPVPRLRRPASCRRPWPTQRSRSACLLACGGSRWRAGSPRCARPSLRRSTR